MFAEPSDDSTETMSSTEPETDAEPSDESNGSTNSPDRRWWLTNDILTGALVGSLILGVILGGLGVLNLQTVPDQIVLIYIVSVGSAVVWAFGADAVEAWRGGE